MSKTPSPLSEGAARSFGLDTVALQILEASPHACAVLDASFRYVYVNEAFQDLYKKHLEQLIGKTPDVIVGKEVFDSTVRPPMEESLKGEAVEYEAEFDIPHLTPRWMRIKYVPLYDEAGGVSGLISQIRDITKKKEEEQNIEMLERERLFIRQIEEVMGVGMFVWDVETQSNVYISDSLAHIQGVTPEYLAEGVTSEEADVELAIAEDRPRVAEAYKNSRLHGTPLNVEYRIKHPEKGLRWLHEVAARHTLGESQRIVTMGLMSDITERKRIEADLETQRMVAAQAEKIGKIGYWTWDLVEDRALFFSDQTAAIHGVSREEFAEMQTSPEADLSRIHPDDYERIRSAVAHSREGDGSFNEEYRINHPDGGVHWVQEVAVPHTVIDGKVTVLLGTLQDVTERRKREEDIRQRDIVYRQIETSISIGYWTWNEENYGPLYISDSIPEIYGLSREEYFERCTSLEGETSLVHPEDRSWVEKKAMEFQETGEATDLEYRIMRPDGTVRWVYESQAALQLSATGKPQTSVGTIRDITVQKQGEEYRHQRELMFSHIDQHFDVGVWAWRLEPYGMYYISDAYCRIFGRTVDEMIEQTSSRENELDAVHPDDRDRVRDLFLNKNDKGLSYDAEFRIIRKDGTVRWVHEIMSPLQVSDDGVLLSSIGVLRDITEQKEREEALRIAVETAERANLAKSDFLAHMSHELRTPLNAVLGFSDAMRSEIFGPLGDDRYRSYLDNIQSSGRLLLALINDLLDMAAIEAGELSISLEPQDIGVLVEEMLTLAGPMAHTKEIVVTNDGGLAGLNLMVDPRRFRQIVLNLVINAIKYTENGGDVSVSGAIDDQGRPTLSVRDNGVGMTEDELEAALIPFKQIKNASIRQVEGTGIGLPLTNQLVQLHLGSLSIKSEKGQGTTVTVILPAERMIQEP